ncbi:endonuclease/exonuclease/phosphatase family protein [Cupriavidus taiwanensis]|uniref:Metal dependent endonuclease/phosphatase n=2 Tax=Cupriavidus TaxID=106589 RepID=A0A375H4U2_9BURK|nr:MULTISPECIES: endonuclease/exonuclease/phosphatase family protein [Cupriavidus]SOY54406.1 putative metal dependent endonuclease/phosphatase [Cupriavidus taiwanensis]SOY55214.1 putative metal dependent endonuclease/phosphatase [Cupriavidus taiwanensis]SOY89255.1 putative metal dependent endonuclease/phosphatase [Cupriavidus taiwanensis]SOZ24861.1 putative metal dependent endonuclease/phosphatase [Cupriavidus taiwanensis]SOZ36928.1 putative metal dependent endonuclease/phosphatase [Cupriavidu
MKLRVVTYNIHKGVTGIARRPRIQNVRAGLHAMDADIVFLQEVQDRNDRLVAAALFDPEHTQLNYLATDAYPHSVYGRNAVYDYGHHGNAILSRHPILMSENLDISDHRFEQRGLLHAVADVHGVETHLICVHFGLFARSRARQAEALVERVQNVVPAGVPLVIAGDFNDWNHRLDAQICNTLGAVEASHARGARLHTFPSHMPWWQLDRIYVRGYEIERAHALTGRDWAQRSDHVPLVAELGHPLGGMVERDTPADKAA